MPTIGVDDHEREEETMDTIADLVREGVPVIPAIRLVLSPPPRLKGRVRAGAAQSVSPVWWNTQIPGWEGVATPPRRVGLAGCAHCGCHNAVGVDLFRTGTMVDCRGEACDAVLNRDGTWVPEGTPPRPGVAFTPMR